MDTAIKIVRQLREVGHVAYFAGGCVRDMLRGTTVVFIGGDPRPAAQASLEQAFELAELVWLPSEEHQSIELFRPHVARSAVALVMLAIRWSSHSFGEPKP